MDDFIRYILIIFGIVFYLYRQFASNKKSAERAKKRKEAHNQQNQPETNSTPSENQPKSIFDELVESVMEEHERQNQAKTNQRQAELQESSRQRMESLAAKNPMEAVEYYDYDYEKEPEPKQIREDKEEEEFVRSDNYKIKPVDNKLLNDIKERLGSPEGAREAFIMSEIFNKKF